MRNNVEIDILRVIFSSILLKEGRQNSEYLKGKSVFDYIGSGLVRKLKGLGFIGEDEGYFLRYRGYIAVINIVGVIVHALREKALVSDELARKLFDEGFCLGGWTKDFALHGKLLKAFLEDLTRLNLLKFEDSRYSLKEEEVRCKLALDCLSNLVDMGSLRLKSELEETMDVLKANLLLEKKLSLGYLMETLAGTTLARAKSILSSSASSNRLFSEAVKLKQKRAISEKDWLDSAAYWQLEATLHEDEGNREKLDFCRSRSFVSLAIFWKRNNDFARAAKYYENASEIMGKYPAYARNAKLQLANSLMCKGKKLSDEDNFAEASIFYTRASELFASLGMNKESIFCEFRNLDCQARENALREEFLAASELMKRAASIMKGTIEKYYQSCLAEAKIYEARHLEKIDDFEAACKCHAEASELFGKAGLSRASLWSRAHSLQCRAFAMRDSKAPYSEIGKVFLQASTYYVEGQSFETAKVCEADSLKYQGLDAVMCADWAKAVSLFEKGKMIFRELAFSCDDPLRRASYRMGETWFEAMRIESMADQKLLTGINEKADLGDVEKLLAHAADLFTRVGDFKHAEIDSSLIMITSAIDAFHKGDAVKANSLIDEAKQRLPRDFVFSLLEDKIRPGWQPLRYTIAIMKDFDAYARKIETEKGFSFESRMRELIRKIHPQYHAIEPKSFKPEKDEIGIVFRDDTPVEIDAIGTRESADNLFLIVAEMKNVSGPVGKHDMMLFMKKVEFVEKRYSRIAGLQAFKKAIVENKLFMAINGFDPSAKHLAEKNNVKMYEKSEINELLKKHHTFQIP